MVETMVHVREPRYQQLGVDVCKFPRACDVCGGALDSEYVGLGAYRGSCASAPNGIASDSALRWFRRCTWVKGHENDFN